MNKEENYSGEEDLCWSGRVMSWGMIQILHFGKMNNWNVQSLEMLAIEPLVLILVSKEQGFHCAHFTSLETSTHEWHMALLGIKHMPIKQSYFILIIHYAATFS